MKLTTEQITKLNVTEIRKELKQRGLEQGGTKAQLISRLISVVEKEKEAETAPEEPAPAPEPEKQEEEAKDSPDKTKPIQEDGEIKPKHKPIVYNIPQKDSSTKHDEEAKKRLRAERFGIVDSVGHEDKKQKSRNVQFSKVSDEETSKMEERAKRFSQPSGGGGRTDGRGLIDLSHIVSSPTLTEDEKKKRRAERFGTAKN